MRFPVRLGRLRNTQGGMRSTASSGSTPSTPYTGPPSDETTVTVKASAPTVYRGVRITFTGTVSNAPAGVTLSYSWTFGEGATDTQGINDLISSCKYDTLGKKTVTLTVSYTDTNGDPVTASGSVTITVGSPPLPWRSPMAHAGMNQAVAVNEKVSFDGSGSTSPYGGSLTYSWDFDDETNPTADSDEIMPSYTYTTTGTKTVTLTVTDSTTELTDSDEAIINVKPPPEADAGGDRTVGQNKKVIFDGSGSIGTNLSYLWAFGDETNPTASSDKRIASYTYTTTGTKTVSLIVTDKDTGLRHRDTATITVRPPPEAEAGKAQTVGVNTAVSFSGKKSKGTNLSYSWVFGADADPFTGSGPTPSCTYSAPGAKIVTLTVTDGDTELTDSDEVTINVEPVANAGNDQTVGVGDTVNFDGSGSIGSNLSYSWDFGANATPAIGSGPTPSCTYSKPGAKKVTLTVTNTVTVMNTVTKLTHSDEVIINVEPVARAGSDQIADVGETVNFDGSGSVGSNLSYSWDFGANATPATAISMTPQTSCTYSTTGTKTVTLTVTQGKGAQSRSHTDTLTVTVIPIQTTGRRNVSGIEEAALTLTFGDDVDGYLVGEIEIVYSPKILNSAGEPIRGKVISDTEIQLISDYNPSNLVDFGIFIHEAAHIWQRQTDLHRGKAYGDYDYTLDQLHDLTLNREEHASAVEDWFVANYAYTHGLIGNGPGQVLAHSVWRDPLYRVLGYSWDAIYQTPDSEKIRIINAHYKRLIDQIRNSTLLPIGQNYPNPFD